MSILDEVYRDYPDWTPPPREFGGENIEGYYAMMLLETVVAMMAAKYRIFEYSQIPIAAGFPMISEAMDSVEERLRENLHYYNGPDENLFTDFKKLRGMAERKIGHDMGIADPFEAEIAGSIAIDRKFRPGMTTEAALDIARAIVSEWDWWEDVDNIHRGMDSI